jgi:hypothetical protein
MSQNPFPYLREICETAGSETSISVMKNWIDRCRMKHQHTPPRYDCKPTRLLKLMQDGVDSVQLCSPVVPVDFAALSYRWGLGKQSETTSRNVLERSKNLEISGLPKTLRDAIHVTRRLGLEYIWIDRICIVQDDIEEWAKEASLMANIYASAYVVLSATATEDCKDGFLGRRMQPLDIQYGQSDQGYSAVCARQIDSHECRQGAIRPYHALFQRGWCMQERFLACRTIHFLSDELLFECPEGRDCECGDATQEDYFDTKFEGFDRFASLRNAPDMKGHDFGREWLAILWHYSFTMLTYGEDSLPALSGLASCMEHLNPGKYIAGMWQHDIAVQLGWSVDMSSGIRRWKYPENDDIIGPTFSWSSHVRPMEAEAQIQRRDICTLESSEVELATSNPYGQVLNASLCLSGQVMLGNDMISCLKTHIYDFQTVRLDTGFNFENYTDSSNVVTEADYKKLKNEKPWEFVICFGLYVYEGPRVPSVDALLLEPKNNGAEVYVRIGVVHRLRKSWFDEHAVPRTITVV